MGFTAGGVAWGIGTRSRGSRESRSGLERRDRPRSAAKQAMKIPVRQAETRTVRAMTFMVADGSIKSGITPPCSARIAQE